MTEQDDSSREQERSLSLAARRFEERVASAAMPRLGPA